MPDSAKTAAISAVSAIIGALAGAFVSGYFAYQIADVQFRQSKMSTAAQSALAVRNTLAEKVATFVLANQAFLYAFDQDEPNLDRVRAAAMALDKARAELTPYLDADLLIACNQVADSVQSLLRLDAEGSELETYRIAYKEFMNLYLRLRRDLERHAQLDLMESQISDKFR